MLASRDITWGIVGVTQRSATVARHLAPQNGLFTVSERGQGSAPVRVVSSITEAISGRDNPEAVVQRISHPDTAIITLTITEKGYRFDPQTGGLDLSDELVKADLNGSAPLTAVGQLTRGLQRRAARDAGPITVVSCDNLPANGELTKRLVLDFAAALPAEESGPLTAWIKANTAFPSTMVDRMVPATTADDLQEVEQELGLRDEAAVAAEPFMQWVIEDNFASRRPRWEDAGAVFTADVAPWEAAKLRLLNASHSLLAYLGLASGKETIAEAVSDDAFRAACAGLMLDDVLPVMDLPDGLNGKAYCAQILERFGNSALGHTTAKVGSDGSQKIGLRLLTTVRDNLDAGREPRWAALAVAAWMRHVATTAADRLDDPLTEALHAALPAPGNRTADMVVPTLLGVRNVFDKSLAEDERFITLLKHWYGIIENGPDGLRKEILHG